MASRVAIITPVKARSEQDVLWLLEAIESVRAQDYESWNMIVVNDHSEVSLRDDARILEAFRSEGRLTAKKAETFGVAGARNTGADYAISELLLPLDHDDTLPEGALKKAVDAWDAEGSKHGIVHGDMLMMQENSSRIYKGQAYSFDVLLDGLFMPVGCLHRKSDWQAAGGWDYQMDSGLEDWEYWIRLGKAGVCGYYVPEVLYNYRRHARGRLAHLREDLSRYEQALAKIRQLHPDVYAGRRPVGCCGGSARTARPAPSYSAPSVPELQQVPSEDLVQVAYVGNSGGGFFVQGRRTQTRYLVPGKNQLLKMPDGRQGVLKEDAPLLVGMERGQAFQLWVM